jgi:hypothetical protein
LVQALGFGPNVHVSANGADTKASLIRGDVSDILEMTATRLADDPASFMVKWKTEVATKGWIEYGTDPTNLGQVAYDIRGESTVGTVAQHEPGSQEVQSFPGADVPQQPAPSAAPVFVFPSSGLVGWTFDPECIPRADPNEHCGIDIWTSDPAAPPPGNEMWAAYPGKVVHIYRVDSRGGFHDVFANSSDQEKRDAAIVVLEHDNNPVVVPGWGEHFYTYYMHLAKQSGLVIGQASESYVAPEAWGYLNGAPVKAGTVLGRQGDIMLGEGNTPASNQLTHLHFSIIDSDQGERDHNAKNPLDFLLPGVEQPGRPGERGWLQIGMLYSGQTLRQTLSGNIELAAKVYSVYFQAEQGSLATISMRRQTGSLDSYLKLFDPDGRLVNNPAGDDNRGGDRNALT